MTNKLATVLFVLIVAGIAIDYHLHGTVNLIFLGKKFYAFLDWIAFWR